MGAGKRGLMLSGRPAATIRVAPHPGRAILRAMQAPVLVVHGPPAAEVPLVLDSPHSGAAMPSDFCSVRTEAELREGEDSFIDELYRPATARGVPLLAALFPRTYLDVNRHADDIDPELLAEPWPQPLEPSAKARIGKAIIWRTMDGDRPIYDRRLSVAEMQRRIAHYHRPYHETLRGLLDGAHARFGAVWHLNCHSMGPNTSMAIEGVDGRPRADQRQIPAGGRGRDRIAAFQASRNQAQCPCCLAQMRRHFHSGKLARRAGQCAGQSWLQRHH